MDIASGILERGCVQAGLKVEMKVFRQQVFRHALVIVMFLSGTNHAWAVIQQPGDARIYNPRDYLTDDLSSQIVGYNIIRGISDSSSLVEFFTRPRENSLKLCSRDVYISYLTNGLSQVGSKSPVVHYSEISFSSSCATEAGARFARVMPQGSDAGESLRALNAYVRVVRSYDAKPRHTYCPPLRSIVRCKYKTVAFPPSLSADSISQVSHLKDGVVELIFRDRSDSAIYTSIIVDGVLSDRPKFTVYRSAAAPA